MKRDKSNPVAKYMRKYNKATVQTDRKKDAKRGYTKHKGQYAESDEAKVECPKCDGAGCKHCDDKGYHTETYRASMASRAAANKMYGRQHPEQDKPKVGVTKKATPGLDSKGRMVKDKDTAATRKKAGSLSKAIAKKYGTKNEEVETNSAAKKAIYVTNPVTGKRETKMEPVHRKKLDKMHKDHDDMHEGVEECWDTHQKVGTKIKNGKVVNDCRPKSEGLALPGYPEQEKLKVVDPFKKVSVKEEGLLEYLRVKTNPAFVSTKSTRDTNTGGNKQKQSSQSITTTSGNGYKVSRNIKTGQTTKSRTNVGGKKMNEAMSVKLRNKMKELNGGELPRSSVEMRKLKTQAQAELKKGREDKRNAPKKVSFTKKGNVHMGNKGSDERNIIMQLRKAQDLGGKFDIRVSPKQGRTTRLDKGMIDKLLKNYDQLQKPQQKRAFVVQVTRALRKRAK